MQFLSFFNDDDIKKVLEKIDVDKNVLNDFIDKAKEEPILLYDVKTSWANILKQEMLSLGADAAISRKSYNCSKDFTDVLLLGSKHKIKKLYEKLNKQPHCFKDLCFKLKSILNNDKKFFYIAGKKFNLQNDFITMGILNATPDSFSDGGKYNTVEKALKRVDYYVNNGVDLVDLGGESTRPKSSPVSEKEEINRVKPIIKAIKENFDIPISIDSYKSKVIQMALDMGVSVVNDISSGDAVFKNIDYINKYNASVIIMKNNSQNLRGAIQNLDNADILRNFIKFSNDTILKLKKNGLNEYKIALDFGLGFGLSKNDISKFIKYFKSINLSISSPIIFALSRKSYLNNFRNKDLNLDYLTNCISLLLMKSGVKFFRTHDPEGLNVMKKIYLNISKV